MLAALHPEHGPQESRQKLWIQQVQVRAELPGYCDDEAELGRGTERRNRALKVLLGADAPSLM